MRPAGLHGVGGAGPHGYWAAGAVVELHRLLDPYHDPALDVDLTVSVEDLAAHEQARLAACVATVAVTGAMPRRLSNATRDELALDKKRARRVLHVLRQSLAAWGGTEREPTGEERSAGAQLDWQPWCEAHQVEVQARLKYVATWGKKTGNLRFAKTAVVRLKQELEWMAYALRD